MRQPWGLKEKTLTETFDDGAVRFQGAWNMEAPAVLDRTTLTPLDGGRMRQVIETSQDNGESWTIGWEGVYIPTTE